MQEHGPGLGAVVDSDHAATERSGAGEGMDRPGHLNRRMFLAGAAAMAVVGPTLPKAAPVVAEGGTFTLTPVDVWSTTTSDPIGDVMRYAEIVKGQWVLDPVERVITWEGPPDPERQTWEALYAKCKDEWT